MLIKLKNNKFWAPFELRPSHRVAGSCGIVVPPLVFVDLTVDNKLIVGRAFKRTCVCLFVTEQEASENENRIVACDLWSRVMDTSRIQSAPAIRSGICISISLSSLEADTNVY